MRRAMDPGKTVQMEVVMVVLLLLIPWPGQITLRPPCHREKAALVRKVVSKRWVPVLDRLGAKLPIDCPLHPIRDVFSGQEAKKIHLAPQWTCGFCGKSFYHEVNLDKHFDNRHYDMLNEAEDSVCLADFCDVMRCEVLQERIREFDEASTKATALDLWHQPLFPTTATHRPHTQPDNSRGVERAMPRSITTVTPPWPPWTQNGGHNSPPSDATGTPGTEKEGAPYEGSDQCDSEHCGPPEDTQKDGAYVEGGPRELPLHPLHSWRDTCNEEHLAELRVKCQQLIQSCIGGLVLNYTLEQIKEVEAALHRGVCWYLTCERYWEAGTMEPPVFPWGLVTGLVLLLTLGVSLCYYVVWVLCESHDAVATPMNSGGVTFMHNNPIMNPRVTVNSVDGHPISRSSHQLSSASTSRARFCATESESECRDSGFNEGPLYPGDPGDQGVPYEYDTGSYRSRHLSEDSRMSSLNPEDMANSRYYHHEEKVFNYASSFTPNYEHRRLRRNRYNYLDDFDSYSEVDADSLDAGSLSRERSDSFIYVSYPPEAKKKYSEQR